MKITRILTRICASRNSIFNKNENKINFKQTMIRGFIYLMNNCPAKEQFASEILEYLSKIIVIIGSNFIFAFQKCLH